jgi:hypothetical protein
MSGRSLRRLPFLAHAKHLHGTNIPMQEMLDALDKVLLSENTT